MKTLREAQLVTSRYLTSKNQDLIKDFKSLSNFFKKVEVTNNEEKKQLFKLKKKSAEHLLDKTRRKGIELKGAFEQTPFTKTGYSILQDFLYSSSEGKELEQFEELCTNADLESLIQLIQMKSITLNKKAKVLQAMGKDTEAEKLFQIPTTDGEIPAYVQEAIDTLSKNEFHTVEDLSKTYGSLSDVAVSLNDDSEFNPNEKRKLFSLISDVYRTKLNELERQNKDYNIHHPKYCDNPTFSQKLLLRLINCKTNKEAIDTYVEFTKYLNYRADVFRTSEQEANKMLKNYLEMIELLQDDSIDVTLLFNKHTTSTSN